MRQTSKRRKRKWQGSFIISFSVSPKSLIYTLKPGREHRGNVLRRCEKEDQVSCMDSWRELTGCKEPEEWVKDETIKEATETHTKTEGTTDGPGKSKANKNTSYTLGVLAIACVAGGMASAKARNKVLAAEPP